MPRWRLYALSKHKFPGANVFMTMIVFSLMFAKEVTNIPELYHNRLFRYDRYILGGDHSQLGLDFRTLSDEKVYGFDGR